MADTNWNRLSCSLGETRPARDVIVLCARTRCHCCRLFRLGRWQRASLSKQRTPTDRPTRCCFCDGTVSTAPRRFRTPMLGRSGHKPTTKNVCLVSLRAIVRQPVDQPSYCLTFGVRSISLHAAARSSHVKHPEHRANRFRYNR